MSQMGSSVFHGGMSTFIAIAMLGFAKLYTLLVFFKTWIIIIIFGLLNGIILLPILLSMFGPVENHGQPNEFDKDQEIKTQNNL